MLPFFGILTSFNSLYINLYFSGYTELIFFSKARKFLTNFDHNRKYKNEIEDNDEKSAYDLATQFPEELILRPIVSTETTGWRGSLI